MRTTTAAITAGILLALTGCTSSNDAKPKTAPTAAAATPEYDAADCRELLERNYAADANSDVSAEPECAHLPDDQYGDLVGSVLAGHKDDILDQAADEVAWDTAWEQTPAGQQQTVCDRLMTDGTDVVGKELAEASGEPTGNEVEMAQYFLDEKC
ncbi:hypothetical protein [Streptomyces sp. NPDC057429]|uniref:hypothetical protein n=1 Tax=Streptomyces sp. NPDC057429 TaxID=3346130 RepID=UPI00368E6579